jgi:hypothetical protein
MPGCGYAVETDGKEKTGIPNVGIRLQDYTDGITVQKIGM